MANQGDTRDELMGLIRRAKSPHIRWRAYAEGLVGEIPVSDDCLPIKHTECKFAQWYYGEGRRLLGPACGIP